MTLEKENKFLPYGSSYEHLADELRKLDLLIQRRVMAFRLQLQALQEAATPQQRYISHGVTVQMVYELIQH
ncbi:MAG: hypothetical protein PVF45_06410 [Anaerolineae bacterium]|jgi:hypothetical protein